MQESARKMEVEILARARDEVERARVKFDEKEVEVIERCRNLGVKNDRLEEEVRSQQGESLRMRAEIESAAIKREETENENARLREQIETLEGRQREVLEELSKSKMSSHAAELKLASMSQKSSSFDSISSSHAAEKSEWKRTVSLLEASVSASKAKCDTLEGAVRKASKEIEKGNGIIAKVKDVNRKLRGRVKTAEDEARRLKSTLDDCAGEISRLKTSNSSLSLECTSLNSSLKDANDTIKNLKCKNEESGRLLKSNQQVISWLNREINDAQVGRVSGMFDGGVSTTQQGGKDAVGGKGVNYNVMTPTTPEGREDGDMLGRYVTPVGEYVGYRFEG